MKIENQFSRNGESPLCQILKKTIALKTWQADNQPAYVIF